MSKKNEDKSKKVIAPAIPDLERFISNDDDSFDEEAEGSPYEGQEEPMKEERSSISSRTSEHKRNRSASPDQNPRPQAARRRQDEEDPDKEDQMALQEMELDEIGITQAELELLDFTMIDMMMSHKDLIRYAKTFKLWRQVKDEKQGIRRSRSLTDQIPHGIEASWKQFVQYAKGGFAKIFEEIGKRRGYKLRSLNWQRDNVHNSCVWNNFPCGVFLKENDCKLCWKEKVPAPKGVTFEQRPWSENRGVEEQVLQYEKTLVQHQRKQKMYANVESHTHRQDRERPPREDFRESKSRDRSRSRSIERDRRGYSVGTEMKREREGYARNQRDRSYRSSDEGYWDSGPYERRSPRRSNAHHHGSRSRDEHPVDYARSGDWNYQSLQESLASQQKQIFEGLSLAAGKREQLLVQLSETKAIVHRLSDQEHNRDKLVEKLLAKNAKQKETIKKLVDGLATAQARLQSLERTVAHLVKKDQRVVDQKSAAPKKD